ncbi:tetratricopeptide repeat protein [Vreelandella sp. GE22]
MIGCLYRTLYCLTAAVVLTAAAPVYSLDEDTQAAKDEGMRLWGIHQWETMQPPLEIAAEAGDVESMYYLGEANRLLSRGLSNAAMDWYYQAAQDGEPYTMLRLDSGGACKLGGVCPEEGDDWRKAALDAALPKAEEGDTDAMVALYSIYAKLGDMEVADHWLLEAAEADNTYAQDWLGRRIRSEHDSYGSYVNDTERLEAAEAWFRRAAELGYAPSMNNLSATLVHLGRLEEAYDWMIRASDAGMALSRFAIGWCYIEPEYDVICPDEPHMAAGVGILEAMVEEINKPEAKSLLDGFSEPLTDQEQEEADAVKTKWLNHQPPLSYFPAKFGF